MTWMLSKPSPPHSSFPKSDRDLYRSQYYNCLPVRYHLRSSGANIEFMRVPVDPVQRLAAHLACSLPRQQPTQKRKIDQKSIFLFLVDMHMLGFLYTLEVPCFLMDTFPSVFTYTTLVSFSIYTTTFRGAPQRIFPWSSELVDACVCSHCIRQLRFCSEFTAILPAWRCTARMLGIERGQLHQA